MQGKTINGFTLQEKIGKGGMAEVWLAETSIGKKAAVKLLLPKFCADEAVVARFANEAKVMVELEHPNIRQVYDYCNLDGRPCILMEYLEGGDLKALMKSGRHFTDAELRKWWDQIADALNYTHAQGIVHRDIKPSNLFLTKKDNIKLLDFGIAKIKESISLTQTGAMMGTLMYMSPEQVEDSKHIGPESDIYSLAVTFVHLLTGKAPYDITNSSDYAIRKGIVEEPLDLSALSANWQCLLAPYLEKKPGERPALCNFEMVLQEDEEEKEDVSVRPENDPESTIVENPYKSTYEPSTQLKTTDPSLTSPIQEKEKNYKGFGIEILGAGVLLAIVAIVVILIIPHNNDNSSTMDDNSSAMDDNEELVEQQNDNKPVMIEGDGRNTLRIIDEVSEYNDAGGDWTTGDWE